MSELETAALFDEMAEEYDEIGDLWYSWLFARLHILIVRFLEHRRVPPRLACLDIGCGTGFQTILLALCGHTAEGIDVSKRLLERALRKSVDQYLSHGLFDSPYRFVQKYWRETQEIVRELRAAAPLGEVHFQVASARNIPFPDGRFDIVNCCGSTLSFIQEYATALSEMGRVLRPGGLLLLEVENKYNLDLIWPIIDACTGGALGYKQELRSALRNASGVRKEHVRVNFPFSRQGQEVTMPIWLFSASGLEQELRAHDVQVLERHGIHSVTNVLPSVWLDTAGPSKRLIRSVEALVGIEAAIGSWPLVRSLGCSLVLFGQKRGL